MTDLDAAGRFQLGDRRVRRMGYGAMQLAGAHAFGPPKDHDAAIAVLRAAVRAGVDHIDTSDYYGPHVTNRLIAEALHPYPRDLVIVTKVGGKRADDGAWLPAQSPAELTSAVHDNLKNLQREAMEVVNLRIMGAGLTPSEGSIGERFEVLVGLQKQGLVRHIGLSNVTAAQVNEARAIGPVACVQNHYNLAHRDDDELIDALAAAGIPYVPFFPLGGFSPLQSDALSAVAAELGATPMQTALAWLLQRSPNILLIPGTASLAHLDENLASASLKLPPEAVTRLDAIGAPKAG